MEDQRVPDVPDGLRHLIQVNVTYSVFICPAEECRKAVQPNTFTDHLHENHSTPLPERRRVQAYINEVGWTYDCTSITRPADGSKPQPTISVTRGLECRLCPRDQPGRPFKTSNWKVMKNHGIGVHKMQRVKKHVLGRDVLLQSWSRRGGQERYWRVEERQGESGRDEDDRLRETPAVDDGDDIGAAGATDEEATIVVDDGVIVISSDGSDDEVLVRKRAVIAIDDDSDSEVLPRKKRAVVASHSDDSDNEVLVPIKTRAVKTRAVRSNRVYSSDSEDADYEPSTDKDGDSSGVESERSDDGDREESSTAAVDEEDEVANPSPWKVRVTKPPVLVDPVGRGIDDSEDDPDPPSRRSPKRRKRSPPLFVDSGVVMPSSQDDRYASDAKYVPASSPPNVIWVVDSGSGGGDERRPPLEVLRERLEVWCRACPVCVLAQDGGRVSHRMEHCWREDTVDIVSKARILQQHIEDAGGFRGEGGCRWCGVPRAICQRWQARPGGSWEEVAGQACQYRGTLTAAVMTMMKEGYGCHEGRAVATEWMRRDGVELQPRDEVFGWFRGARVWEGIGMQVARMVWVFNMLVNKNRGVGKV
jgi:hypothetical protein